MHIPMPRQRNAALAATCLLLSALLVWRGAATTASTVAHAVSPYDGLQKIKHIVIIMQENRSFDHYFGTYPGADGFPQVKGTPTARNPDPRTQTCAPVYHLLTDADNGGFHRAADTSIDVDGSKMDGFIQDAWNNCQTHPTWNPACSNPSLPFDVMGYYDQREIPNYWTYAKNFVLQDHMYASSVSFSASTHLYMLSGWTANGCTAGQPMTCRNTVDNPPFLDDFPQNGQPIPQNQLRPVISLLPAVGRHHRHRVPCGRACPDLLGCAENTTASHGHGERHRRNCHEPYRSIGGRWDAHGYGCWTVERPPGQGRVHRDAESVCKSIEWSGRDSRCADWNRLWCIRDNHGLVECLQRRSLRYHHGQFVRLV